MTLIVQYELKISFITGKYDKNSGMNNQKFEKIWLTF